MYVLPPHTFFRYRPFTIMSSIILACSVGPVMKYKYNAFINDVGNFVFRCLLYNNEQHEMSNDLSLL